MGLLDFFKSKRETLSVKEETPEPTRDLVTGLLEVTQDQLLKIMSEAYTSQTDIYDKFRVNGNLELSLGAMGDFNPYGRPQPLKEFKNNTRPVTGDAKIDFTKKIFNQIEEVTGNVTIPQSKAANPTLFADKSPQTIDLVGITELSGLKKVGGEVVVIDRAFVGLGNLQEADVVVLKSEAGVTHLDKLQKFNHINASYSKLTSMAGLNDPGKAVEITHTPLSKKGFTNVATHADGSRSLAVYSKLPLMVFDEQGRFKNERGMHDSTHLVLIAHSEKQGATIHLGRESRSLEQFKKEVDCMDPLSATDAKAFMFRCEEAMGIKHSLLQKMGNKVKRAANWVGYIGDVLEP